MPVLEKQVEARRKTRCTICASHRLASVMELPKLPLTGIYVNDHSQDYLYPEHDQAFLVCEDCGHGQLKYALDPEYLYEDTYTHRGGLSPIASGGNEFFASFLQELTGGRKFKHAVDIGCSDLYLLEKIADKAERRTGIDPIWRNKNHVTRDDIKVIGKFVEEIDWERDIDDAPDLIVSAHTFEHVDESREQLQRAVIAAKDGAVIVIEVPGFDSMLTSLRFDQVFHQHINHYSVSSFLRLIEELGCSYLDHTFNYGFWSGTMLMAFVKGSHETVLPKFVRPTPQLVRERFDSFKRHIEGVKDAITLINEPIYGYGGAQMAPILAYHMDSDFSFLEAILDDNPDRHGKSYPHMPVVIRLPDAYADLSKTAVLITALDSSRPILRRVEGLNARRVLLPLHAI